MSFSIPVSIVDKFALGEGDRIITAERKVPFCSNAEPQFVRAYDRNLKFPGALTVEDNVPVAILISNLQNGVRCEVVRVTRIHIKRPGSGHHDRFGERNCLIEDSSDLNGFIANCRPFRENLGPKLWMVGRPIRPENTRIDTGVARHEATAHQTRLRLIECFPGIAVCIEESQLKRGDMEVWARCADASVRDVYELLEKTAMP
jgi:hypothetical protein